MSKGKGKLCHICRRTSTDTVQLTKRGNYKDIIKSFLVDCCIKHPGVKELAKEQEN